MRVESSLGVICEKVLWDINFGSKTLDFFFFIKVTYFPTQKWLKILFKVS